MADAQVAGFIVAVVLGITYVTMVTVALFHPDEQRRASALRALQDHRLARKKGVRTKR